MFASNGCCWQTLGSILIKKLALYSGHRKERSINTEFLGVKKDPIASVF